ncbi:recombinase family protein [Allorhizobium taibaishanense]|uniref:DNA invertase Pin-like site-specific DNA recombinase n=1 Tax=Allorhizobium taibaishanense TaxID=887144 RepID=A0A1Q9A2X9_9HYPH|nr:DNA invertase Pin-like site-specific DNA recombinase [Allorhizobium taibaishanense]OLP48975.1 hypothetical protein BJF91_17810 [Allorhizobium taibaishanense]
MRPVIGPTRAFLYARSASESQNASTAKVDEQLHRLRKHAHDRAYVVVGEAYDNPRYDLLQPGPALVMSLAARAPLAFDVFIVTDVHRLGRDERSLRLIRSHRSGAGIRTELIVPPIVLWEPTQKTSQGAPRSCSGREKGGRDEEE